MGGNNKQQYCLRWNQHRTNMLSVFDQLLQSEALTDVTLSCQGASIKCHRIVLAASSGYFQALFLDGQLYGNGAGAGHQHPIVVFKDIQLAELRAILEFIYRGEVSVAQDQVGVLLKAAETLKVKGLYSEDSTSPAGGGLSGLSFEPTSASQRSTSSPFLVQHQQLAPPSGGIHPASSSSSLIHHQQAPICFKRSPIKSPEDKERDGSSSSEATPPEDDRDEPPVDRIKSSRSPSVFEPLKDLAQNPSLPAFVNGVNGVVVGKVMGGGNGQTRPELKRYRQYTRHDIQAAIEAVRAGQSALQASRVYGVPSRTLYDKVKKLGIVTGRPYRQSQAIAMAMSLAQAQHPAGGPAGSHRRQPSVSPGRNGGADDEDSMDVTSHQHQSILHHHFHRRPSTLEELSMYFATSPAAAAAAAAAELALQQQQVAAAAQQHQNRAVVPSTEDEEDDSSVTHPSAPIDLSQSYERMIRVGVTASADAGHPDQSVGVNDVVTRLSPKPTELLTEN